MKGEVMLIRDMGRLSHLNLSIAGEDPGVIIT